ncbi:hypothetical protein PFISCL1PPCAC_17569, partial [Pristionchus fissidentatus]
MNPTKSLASSSSTMSEEPGSMMEWDETTRFSVQRSSRSTSWTDTTKHQDMVSMATSRPDMLVPPSFDRVNWAGRGIWAARPGRTFAPYHDSRQVEHGATFESTCSPISARIRL